MESAYLYAKGYDLKNINFEKIETKIDERIKLFYPYETIPDDKLLGIWQGRSDKFVLKKMGEGTYIPSNIEDAKPIVYKNHGNWFSISVDGENYERKFYLRKNDKIIYELIVANNRWKSRRNNYVKQIN